MADIYTTGINRKKRRLNSEQKKGLWIILLDFIMSLLSLALIFCTLTVVICQYISPVKSGVLSVVSLGAPIIYLLDIVMMMFWVLRWRWYHVLAMALMVVLGLFYLSRYYKIEVDRQYTTSYNERAYTKIMTYNVHEGRKAGFLKYITEHNPDILCVQEMTIGCDNWNQLTKTYQSTYKPNVGKGGNQILTKFKIVKSGEIGDLPHRTATWADLKIRKDTVRVVSLHLQSTAIRPEDTHFIEGHGYINDPDSETKMRSIVSRLVENNQKRAEQAEMVAEFLAKTPYKVIVCGDFNDIPLSYTYRTIAKGLNDTFSEKAVGFDYTFNNQYRLLRIDNILVSPEIEVHSYAVDNKVDLSDHYPVISRVKIKANKAKK